MIKLKELFQRESNEEWIKRHKILTDSKNRLILYHATLPKIAKIIKKSGFKEGSYFAKTSDKAAGLAAINKKEMAEDMYVFKVYLPKDALAIGVNPSANRFVKYSETI